MRHEHWHTRESGPYWLPVTGPSPWRAPDWMSCCQSHWNGQSVKALWHLNGSNQFQHNALTITGISMAINLTVPLFYSFWPLSLSLSLGRLRHWGWRGKCLNNSSHFVKRRGTLRFSTQLVSFSFCFSLSPWICLEKSYLYNMQYVHCACNTSLIWIQIVYCSQHKLFLLPVYTKATFVSYTKANVHANLFLYIISCSTYSYICTSMCVNHLFNANVFEKRGLSAFT